MTRVRAPSAATTTLTRRVARRRPLRDGSGRHQLLRHSRRARRGGSRGRRSGRGQHATEARARAFRLALQRDLRHARRCRSRRRPGRPRRRHRRADLRAAARRDAVRTRVRLARRSRLHRRHRATGGETLDVASVAFEVLAIPGHSPDHVAFFADGCLFSGDLIFANSVGRVDLAGGDWDTLLASARS